MENQEEARGNTLDTLAKELQVTLEKLLSSSTLDLRSQEFTALPLAVSELTGLKKLYISLPQGRVGTQEIPSWISGLTNLELFNIEKGSITSIPAEVGHLVSLTEFVVSNNAVMEIDDAIGKLSSLEILDLSGNMLSTLPTTVGNLKNLKSVDLSNNHFSILRKKVIIEENVDASDILDSPIGEAAQEEGYIILANRKKAVDLLPPEILNLPRCEIFFAGNKGLPTRFMHRIQGLVLKVGDPIKRALQLFHTSRRLPGVDERFVDSLELFASISLLRHNPNEEKYEQRLISYIKMASKADGLLFLENPLVQSFVKGRWDNNVRIQEYFASREKTSTSDDSAPPLFVTYLSILPSALKDLTGPFLPSVRAKFLLFSSLYFFFLVVLMQYLISKNVTYGQPKYFMSQYLRDAFQPPENLTVDGLWDYLRTDFLKTSYFGPDNYRSLAAQDQNDIILSFYRKSGQIILRQKRSKIQDCPYLIPGREVNADDGSPKCIRPVIDFEDTSPYGPNNMYVYSRSKTGGRIYPSFGGMNVGYDDDGFVQYLPIQPQLALQTLENLQKNHWIDMQTRVLGIGVLVINDNLDAVALAVILIELPASGGLLATLDVDVIPRGWLDPNEAAYRPLQLIIWIYAVGFLTYELHRMLMLKQKYFADAWNLFEIAFLILLYGVIFMEGWVYRINDRYGEDQPIEQVKSFYNSLFVFEVQTKLTAGLVLMAWLKLLFIQSIHPSLGPMQLIVFAMAMDILRFLFLLSIFLFGFAFAFYSIYAGYLQSNRSITYSVATLILALFGDFDFEAVNDLDPIFGPFYYYLFMITCTIMLLNFLIAILSGTYEDIKTTSERQYRKLFANAVLALNLAPFPPPLNLVRPLYLTVAYWWTSRNQFFPMFWSWSRITSHSNYLVPISRPRRIWTKQLRDIHPSPCRLIDTFTYKCTTLIMDIFIILGTPVYFAYAWKSPIKARKIDTFVTVIGVILAHFIWIATLIPWGIFWSLYDFKKWIFTKKTSKSDKKNTAQLDDDDENLVEEDLDSGSSSVGDSTIADTTTNANDDQDDDELKEIDLVLKARSNLSLGLVDVVMSGRGEGYGSYKVFQPFSSSKAHNEFEVCIYHPSVAIGLVSLQDPRTTLPGLSNGSVGYDSSTGCFFVDEEMDVKLGPVPCPDIGSIIRCGVDYDEHVVYFIIKEQRYNIVYHDAEERQLCPCVGLIGVRASARLWIRYFDTKDGSQIRKPDTPSIQFISRIPAGIQTAYDPHVLVYGESASGVGTALSEHPVEFSAETNKSFTFIIYNFGQSGYITMGLSTTEIETTDEPGRTSGSIGIRIDRLRLKGTVLGTLGDRQYACNSHLPKIPKDAPMEVGMHFDVHDQYVIFSINKMVVQKFFFRLPEEPLENMHIAVSLNSVGQVLEVLEQDYPAWITPQSQYIAEMVHKGNPVVPGHLLQIAALHENNQALGPKDQKTDLIRYFYRPTSWRDEEEEDDDDDTSLSQQDHDAVEMQSMS